MIKLQNKTKRTSALIAIVIILLFAGLLLVPNIYKNRLVTTAKDYASSALQSRVEFDEIKVSFFSSFPDLSAHIYHVNVVDSSNKQVLKSIMIPEVSLSFKLWNVINKKPSEWEVEQIKIEGASFKYIDKANDSYAIAENIDFMQKGEFTDDNYLLTQQLENGNLTLSIGGYRYLTKASVHAGSSINYVKDSNKVNVIESHISLNQAELALHGSLTKLAGDSLKINLSFNNSNKDFAGLLSLFDFNSAASHLESTGAYSLNGKIEGILSDSIYPAMNSELSVAGGTIRFHEKANSLNDITGKIKVNRPEGSLDSTRIDLQTLTMKLNESPLSVQGSLVAPNSKGAFNAMLAGEINTEDINSTLPIDLPTKEGKINAQLEIKGSLTNMVNKAFNKLSVDGDLQAKNLVIDLPKQAIYKVEYANLLFLGNQTQVKDLSVSFNKSDIRLTGKLDNLLSYLAIENEDLAGNLNLKSEHLNTADFTKREITFRKNPTGPKQNNANKPLVKKEAKPVEKKNPKKVEEKKPAVPVKPKVKKPSNQETIKPTAPKQSAKVSNVKGCLVIPKNLNLNLKFQMNEFVHEQVPAQDIKGTIALKNGKAEIKNLTGEFAQGKVSLKGSYFAPDSSKAQTNFSLKATAIDVESLYKMEHFMPKWKAALKNTSGKFSTELDFTAPLDANRKMAKNAINAKGQIRSKSIKVHDSELFNQLATISQAKAMRNPNIEDLDIKYTIANGKSDLKKGTFKVNKSSFKVFGLIYLDQQLDLVAQANISSEEFPSSTTSAISGFLSSAGIKLAIPKNVKLSVGIYGDLEKPQIAIGQTKPKAYSK